MRINYTMSIKDEHGYVVFPDVECVVDTSVTFDPDDPVVSVDAVNIIACYDKTEPSPEIALRHSSLSFFRLLEGYLAKILETDEDFYNLALENAGVTYRSRGANDPDGHYEEVA